MPLEGAGRAAGVELPGGAPAILGDHLGQLPSDAVGPGHDQDAGGTGGVGRLGCVGRLRGRRQVVEAAAEGVDDADDLVLGRRQRGHEHDDVAERAQQHATLDRARTDPPAPTQTGGGRRQLDPDHEAALADLVHLVARRHPLGQQQ